MIQLREFFPKDLQEASLMARPKVQYFDIFKGIRGPDGRIGKVRSVGSGKLVEGYGTYSLRLKTFLDDMFYLLPERLDIGGKADFAILTREDSKLPGRRYFWNKVGEAIWLDGPNQKLIHLTWDMLGVDDIFMEISPAPECGLPMDPIPDVKAAA